MYKSIKNTLIPNTTLLVVDMSPKRVYLCNLWVISLFGLSFVLADNVKNIANTEEVPKGNCSCGGFPTTTPDVGCSPILSQTPSLVVKCDQEGDSTCKQLCNALATATKAKGPEVLCNKLKDANELKLSAFYKVCDKPWQYADMTADSLLCCENAKVKECPSTKSDAVDSIDSKII